MSELSSAGDANQHQVTLADVRRVAELANLELSADEETSMLRDLTAILGHVAHLNELDTTAVAAMAQVSDAFTSEMQGAGTIRPDKVVPSLERKVVTASSPDTDGVFFKVPKVIER
ncbi:MAG TPA: Asp-tRNA(Asn)/Glu-tRNA(Gln) amidotransferase subunit GatC [Acidisarcina sp.]